jgi:hypothetical protein
VNQSLGPGLVSTEFLVTCTSLSLVAGLTRTPAVVMLAGLSIQYYTRMERGNASGVFASAGGAAGYAGPPTSVQPEPRIDMIFDIWVPATIAGWSGPSVTFPFRTPASRMMMWVRSAAAGTGLPGEE